MHKKAANVPLPFTPAPRSPGRAASTNKHQPETQKLYAMIRALRFSGHRVYRVNQGQHKVDGKHLSTVELMWMAKQTLGEMGRV